MNYPFVRIAAAAPDLQVADCRYNARKIKEIMLEASAQCVSILVLPELSITGYSCGDLFFQSGLLDAADTALMDILEYSRGLRLFVAVGIPIRGKNMLFNCAAAIYNGEILGIVPKTYLPNNREFYEKRWFNSSVDATSKSVELLGSIVPFGTDLIFDMGNSSRIGIEICEDLWSPIPPSSYLALEGANIILNLSASDEQVGKAGHRRELVKNQSSKTYSAYCYAGAGPLESTADVVFGGHCIIGENGRILAEKAPFFEDMAMICSDIDTELLEKERLMNKSFFGLMESGPEYRKVNFMSPNPLNETVRYIDPKPFVPSDSNTRGMRCREIFAIQSASLRKRMDFSGAKTAVLGISGGLDSTLALLATVHAFDASNLERENIIGVTMPGFGTTDRTYDNAVKLIKALKISFREIPIGAACLSHFDDIGHDPQIHDTTYENAQARERTQILMDIANMERGLVIGTGDLSEIALGWSTYNGDHMSMYAINSGIPKTLIKSLVLWAAESNFVNAEAVEVLGDIANTPISPELLPPDDSGNIDQKTEDIVGPYELHDFFLYYMVRYGFGPGRILLLAELAFSGVYNRRELVKWLRVFYERFFSQQFKRSCMPDGPKVGSVALSPRGDWRMPSDASAESWLRELEGL